MLPDGAQILEVHSDGTYDGTRFDGIDASALYDCFFGCPGSFREIGRWFESRLQSLGWPHSVEVDSAPVGDIKLEWLEWTRDKEQVDLIDFTQATWTSLPRPPAGWSVIRLNYSRKPVNEFASDDEYQAWFKEGSRKGGRWRNRPGSP